jgi:hypothetical protein
MNPERDDIAWTNAKLSGPWSAAKFAQHIKGKLLQNCLQRFEKLDPLVRVRLLMACLFLSDDDKATMSDQLASLAKEAQKDDDEWVRAVAFAVGDFTQPLGTSDLAARIPVVWHPSARSVAIYGHKDLVHPWPH